MTIALQPHSDGVVIRVRVRAGGRRNGLGGVRDGALRVEVTAAPEKGKANKAVAELLAEAFGVAKSAVSLVGGATSTQKRFLIAGMDATTAQTRLATQ